MFRKTWSLFVGLAVATMPAAVCAQQPSLEPAASGQLTQADLAPSALPSRLYGRVEYVYWWLREGRIPALLTTSSFASEGRLDQPDTRVLYGDERLETRHDDRFIGARMRLGLWLDDEQTCALEGGAFFLERDSTYFKTVSDGSTLLARPYRDALTGSQASEVFAGPTATGPRSGGFNGYSRIELFSQELNLALNLWASPPARLDLLGGFRSLQMRDRLDLTATSQLLPEKSTIYGLTDHFRVHNIFYGGQLGLRASQEWGPWQVELRATAALGANVETGRAFGDRIAHAPLARDVQPFGLSVLTSNTGRFHRTALDGVYETGLNVGYRLGEHFCVLAGYTFLLWDSPLRANQVDFSVNPNQINGLGGGPARPAIPFRTDLFWAQGLNVGLAFSW